MTKAPSKFIQISTAMHTNGHGMCFTTTALCANGDIWQYKDISGHGSSDGWRKLPSIEESIKNENERRKMGAYK